jgi:WD40 repeat protein
MDQIEPNQDIDPFIFRYPKTEEDFPMAKAAFLNFINKSILEPDSRDFIIKSRCFFLHDNQICIFVNDHDELCASNISFELETRIFGVHVGAAFLFKDNNDRHFYSVSSSGIVKIWNYNSLEMVNEVKSPFLNIQLAFYYTGDKIFLYTPDDIIVFDASTGMFLENPIAHSTMKNPLSLKVTDLEISELPETKMDGKQRSDPEPLKRRHTDLGSIPKKQKPPCMIYSVVQNVLIFSHRSTCVTIWDISSCTIKTLLHLNSRVTRIVLDDKETGIYVGLYTGVIKYFDLIRFDELGEVDGLKDPVSNIVVSSKIPDILFASASSASILIWQLSTGHAIGKLQLEQSLSDEQYSELSKKPRISENLLPRSHSVDLKGSGRSFNPNESLNRIKGLLIDSSGSRIYCITKSNLYFWDISVSYKEVHANLPNYRFIDAAISNTNPQFFYAITSKNVYCFDLWTSELIRKTPNCENAYTCLSLASDDIYLAVGRADGKVVFLSTFNFNEILEIQFCSSPINFLKFYRNIRLFISNAKGIIYIYDLVTKNRCEIKGHFQQVNDFCFIEESNWLLTAGSDQILRLWDLGTLLTLGKATELWRYICQSPIIRIEYNVLNKLIFFAEKKNVFGIDLNTKEMIFDGITDVAIKEEPQTSSSNYFNYGYPDRSVRGDKLRDASEDNDISNIMGFELYIELNMIMIVRESGKFSIIDLSTKREHLGWRENESVIRICRPYKHHLLFCITDSSNVIQINLYKPNFIERCYIQSFSQTLSNEEFRDNLQAFNAHKHLIFIANIIHPLTFAYLLGDSASLDLLFKIYGFPKPNYPQKSPFILSLKERNVSFLDSMSSALVRYEEPVIFNYGLMKMLLSTEFTFLKKLLAAKCFKKIVNFSNNNEKITKFQALKAPQNFVYSLSGEFTKNQIDKLVIQPNKNLPEKTIEAVNQIQQRQTFGNESFLEPLLPYKRVNIQYKPHSLKSKQFARKKEEIKPFKQTTIKKSEIEIIKVSGFYNFDKGSSDSLNFLMCYSKSRIKEFVLSDFKRIIHIKWNQSRLFFFALASAYWSYCILFTLLIFNPHSAWLFYLNFAVICLFIFYEIIPLILFPNFFFQDANNTLDLLSYTLGLAVIIMTYKTDPEEGSLTSILQILIELMIFYRALSYLRIFKKLRHIADVLHKLVISTFDLIVVTSFLIVMFTVISSIANGFRDIYGTFLEIVFVPFTYFPDTSIMSPLEIVVLLAEIYILTLILMNYLIAQMSNKYEELQEHQKLTHYREMAKLLFESEIWYKAFLRKPTGRKCITYIVRDVKPHEEVDEEVLESLPNKFEAEDVLASMARMNEKLFSQIDLRFRKLERMMEIKLMSNAPSSLDSFDQPTFIPKKEPNLK